MISNPGALLFQTFKGSAVHISLSALTTLRKHKKIPEPNLVTAAPH